MNRKWHLEISYKKWGNCYDKTDSVEVDVDLLENNGKGMGLRKHNGWWTKPNYVVYTCMKLSKNLSN